MAYFADNIWGFVHTLFHANIKLVFICNLLLLLCFLIVEWDGSLSCIFPFRLFTPIYDPFLAVSV